MIRIQSVVTKILLILTAYNTFQTFWLLSYLLRLAISRGDFAPKNIIGKKYVIYEIDGDVAVKPKKTYA